MRREKFEEHVEANTKISWFWFSIFARKLKIDRGTRKNRLYEIMKTLVKVRIIWKFDSLKNFLKSPCQNFVKLVPYIFSRINCVRSQNLIIKVVGRLITKRPRVYFQSLNCCPACNQNIKSENKRVRNTE